MLPSRFFWEDTCFWVGKLLTVAAMGQYAYITANGSSSFFRILNVEDPAHIVEVGTCDTGFNPTRIKSVNGRLYVLDPNVGVQIYKTNSTPVVPTPRTATATAQAFNGFVVGGTITDKGSGYTNAPNLLIMGDGKGATAYAVVANGAITQIVIDNTGSGYSNPVVIINPPWASTAPSLKVEVSKVRVVLSVTPGYTYSMEYSTNATDWTQSGGYFTAPQETLVQEYDVTSINRFFRLQEIKKGN